jgi:uncharacterized Zn finger protein
MQCKECGQEKLDVVRRCRQIRLRCARCGREHRIHELAAELDQETEKLLERWNAIIYD